MNELHQRTMENLIKERDELKLRAETAEEERDRFGEMLGDYEDKFKALRARLYAAEDELKDHRAGRCEWVCHCNSFDGPHQPLSGCV